MKMYARKSAEEFSSSYLSTLHFCEKKSEKKNYKNILTDEDK